jgi:hypothetical protein
MATKTSDKLINTNRVPNIIGSMIYPSGIAALPGTIP